MSPEQTTDVVPAGSDEGDAWDAYFDNSEVARMCPCPSCNFYLPPDQYKPDSECEETALIKAIVAAARADERDRMLTPWYVLRRVAQTMPHNPEAVEWLHIQADGWEASGVVAAPVETDLRGEGRPGHFGRMSRDAMENRGNRPGGDA